MPIRFHNDWITLKAKVMFCGFTPPNAANFQICLADTNALTRSSPASAFFTAELIAQYGYQRKNLLWAEYGSFSNMNLRHDLPPVDATWVGSGGAIQFQTAFLLCNAHAKAQETFAPTAINTASNTITIDSNLLANGDQVLFEASLGSTLPNGLPTLTTCFVLSANPATGVFQVSETVDGTPLSLSDQGDGTFRMRYATGSVVLLETEDDPIVVQDGKPNVYELSLAELNTVYGVGV